MTSGQLAIALAVWAGFAQGQDPHAHHRTPAAEGAWVRYRHATGGFSVEHPADWRPERPKMTVSIHIAHPTKAVHLFAAAFDMPEGSLESFAEMKFAVQGELFKALGPVRPLTGPGWNGLVQEAETLETQGGKHARRLMLCAVHENRYVSLTLFLESDELAQNGGDYERILGSLRFGE